MIHFEFTAFGRPAVSRSFDRRDLPRVDNLLDGPDGVGEKIERDFYEIERGQFQSHGSRGGTRWKSLRPRTIAIKDYLMRTRQAVTLEPLIRTGRMWASLTQPGSISGKVRRIGPMTMELGTSVFYAIKHHEGQDGLPKREVIALTVDDLKRWTNIIQSGLNKRIRTSRMGTPAGSRFD